ncbi:MAG: hypothetical protein M3Z85_03185, partial [Acidobacteriota bacterium]|nr:hypothetical protein [Acidobacteriota bacterium]
TITVLADAVTVPVVTVDVMFTLNGTEKSAAVKGAFAEEVPIPAAPDEMLPVVVVVTVGGVNVTVPGPTGVNVCCKVFMPGEPSR